MKMVLTSGVIFDRILVQISDVGTRTFDIADVAAVFICMGSDLELTVSLVYSHIKASV